ncbi:MAG: mRNA cap guanine-N7 methyltransferase [Chaenotheca gracillima]|nr:MAG: mRNA cap guanine-N7 methyltransferase [Chaenotheca gracillima]
MILSNILDFGLLAAGPATQAVARDDHSSSLCQKVHIPVTASADNFAFPKLNDLNKPGAIQDLLVEVGNVLTKGEKVTRGGSFQIVGRYCRPTVSVDRDRDSTIQLLLHGLTYRKEYWSGDLWHSSNSAKYSWTDFANRQGYATLEIDRLGNGESSHPDPAQFNQLPLNSEIVHQIVGKLKEGKIANKRFRDVVPVGHSWGSQLVTLTAQNNPEDFSAIILTGYSSDLSEIPAAVQVLDIQVARDFRARFKTLPQGYLSIGSEAGRTADFYFGGYDHSFPRLDFQNDGVISVGELLSYDTPAPAFRGNVFIATGDHDLPYCGTATPGNCLPAANSTVARTVANFPNAASFHYELIPNTGHDFPYHYSAPKTFASVHKWLSRHL